jgi:hypothetical protein
MYSSLITLFLSILCLHWVGCAEQATSIDQDQNNTGSFGKADITVGPIQSIQCNPQTHFVQRGGFGEFNVNAVDSIGKESRNYELTITPVSGTRIVQRNRVIFDQEGRYDIQCCSLDTPECDHVAVHVGSLNPTLSLNIAPFSEGEVQITGQALTSLGKPAQVWINDQELPTNAQGQFEIWQPSPQGMNRFLAKAMDEDGRTSTRNGWTIGGPFQSGESSRSLLKVALAQDVFRDLENMVEQLLVRSINEYAQGDDFKKMHSGSELGYSFEVMPSDIPIPQINLELTTGPEENQLQLYATIPQFTLLGDARTRFAQGAWKERTISVQADIEVQGTFRFEGTDLALDELTADVANLDVEISDLPGFIEGILEFFFEREVRTQILKALESAGNESLEGIISGFEFQDTLTLPDPLKGDLDLSAKINHLYSNSQGLQIGFDFGFNGETDPRYQKAPGPITHQSALLPSSFDHPYQAQMHIDLFNQFLFELWQMGALEKQVPVYGVIGEEDDDIQADLLTLFISPQLPPVLTLGTRPGEVVFNLGGLRIDGVLESNVGFWNCAIEVGIQARSLIDQWGDDVSFNFTAEAIDIDVLIAPGGWEIESTRRLLQSVINQDVLPDYIDLIEIIPLPQADLSGLRLPSFQSLKVSIDQVKNQESALSFEGNLDFSDQPRSAQ